MQVVLFQDFPLSIFFFVVATKIVNHFIDNELFDRLKSILILYKKASSSKIDFSKNPNVISY